jgi:hypothetical protein
MLDIMNTADVINCFLKQVLNMVYILPEDGTDVVPVHNIKAYRDSRDIAPQLVALPCANRTAADVHEPPYT